MPTVSHTVVQYSPQLLSMNYVNVVGCLCQLNVRIL